MTGDASHLILLKQWLANFRYDLSVVFKGPCLFLKTYFQTSAIFGYLYSITLPCHRMTKTMRLECQRMFHSCYSSLYFSPRNRYRVVALVYYVDHNTKVLHGPLKSAERSTIGVGPTVCQHYFWNLQQSTSFKLFFFAAVTTYCYQQGS